MNRNRKQEVCLVSSFVSFGFRYNSGGIIRNESKVLNPDPDLYHCTIWIWISLLA